VCRIHFRFKSVTADGDKRLWWLLSFCLAGQLFGVAAMAVMGSVWVRGKTVSDLAQGSLLVATLATRSSVGHLISAFGTCTGQLFPACVCPLVLRAAPFHRLVCFELLAGSEYNHCPGTSFVRLLCWSLCKRNTSVLDDIGVCLGEEKCLLNGSSCALLSGTSC